MEMKIKKSVAVLLAHIIKLDNRDIEKETPLFCKLMKQDFGCDRGEGKEFLYKIIKEDYNIDEHVKFIRDVLADDNYTKYEILKQLNRIIYSDNIEDNDYKEFEKIKNILFSKNYK
ncbi:hypothetical protein MNB_SV-15-1180 [hydrothermal vent metagenome]|uniref:Co-chaperone DjlA N-terminal domain-containing protein n=1 Tax=hydrothermal vent metagenome TaxID=652676 RepID=A0A1W1ELA8_9ZZZZ